MIGSDENAHSSCYFTHGFQKWKTIPHGNGFIGNRSGAGLTSEQFSKLCSHCAITSKVPSVELESKFHSSKFV